MSEDIMRHAVATFPTQADQHEWHLEVLDDHLVNLVASTSFEADQYRSLRHIVQRNHPTKKLIAVTSAVDGDGKTTTAINLAGALAEAPEVRVLLWDLDLRTPSVGSRLGLTVQSPGLADLIVDASLTLDEVIRHHPRFRLSVLPTGPAATVPYGLLKSPRMGELLHIVQQRYDYIVLDTPPLVPTPDSRLIADLADGLVIVVAAHRTPRKLLKEALTLTDSSKLIGVVFNRDDWPHHSYHGYYYGYGHYEGRSPLGGERENGLATSFLDKTLRPFLSWLGHPAKGPGTR